MFSCCVPSFRGSGYQNRQENDLIPCCRHWLKPPPQCRRSFRGRRHKKAPEDMVQEVTEEMACSPSSKDKKPHRANRVWRWLRGKNGSTRKRTRTSLLMAERADKLEAAIDHLVPAILRQDLHCVHTFLDTYDTLCQHRGGAGPTMCKNSHPWGEQRQAPSDVRDGLVGALSFSKHSGSPSRWRFGCYYSTYEEVKRPQEQRDMAIYAILNTWVEKYPGDFVQPPEFPSLHTLLAYLQVYVPGSDLQSRAQLLLPESQCPPREAMEPEAGAPAPEQNLEVVPAAPLAPAAPLEPELVSTIPATAAHSGLGRPVTPPDPLGPGQMVVRALVHFSATEEPLGIVPLLDDQQVPVPELLPPTSVEQAVWADKLPPPASVEQAGWAHKLPPPVSVEQAG
ncbi:ral guanine nucleotide dissociation stimulator-like [Mustela putorius furo]|uniref:Ral guanine nucleotide dissociation stimulator-like n=1 Tax=Mustela putorius furo TaxID=9669 RepID=A0A8U0RSE5_MUSPF|nr:ral guanine nucleotide dissociation stimulator-like [Mustela putorius furo]